MADLFNPFAQLLVPLSTGRGSGRKIKSALDKPVEEDQAAPAQPAPPAVDGIGDLPPLPPQEEEGILKDALRTGMSGLQYVAEALDKPRRALHGAWAGRPGELLNLIPFSDAMGLTDPENATSGRDLLEKVGVLGENRPGLDMGDVAGFALEVATDPLSWLSILGKPAQIAAKSTKSLTIAEKAKDIASGAQGLFNLHTPDLTIPWTNIGIKPKMLHETALGKALGMKTSEFGTGAAAAAAYKAMWYGKYSPLAHGRKIFSAVPGYNPSMPTGAYMEELDLAHAAMTRMLGDASDAGAKLFERSADLENKLQGLVDKQFFGGERKRLMAEAVLDAMPTSRRMRRHVAKLAEFDKIDPNDTAAMLASSTMQDKLAGLYHMTSKGMNGMADLADGVKAKFKELAEAQKLGFEAVPDESWMRSVMYSVLERPTLASDFTDAAASNVPMLRGHIIDKLQQAGLDANLAGFDEAVDTFYKFADDMKEMFPRVRDEITLLGGDVPDLQDFFVAYAHRKTAFDNQSAMHSYLGKTHRVSTEPMAKVNDYDFQIARSWWTRHWPGGTEALNKATMDDLITATAKLSDAEKSTVMGKIRTVLRQFGNYSGHAPTQGVWKNGAWVGRDEARDLYEAARSAGVPFDVAHAAARKIIDQGEEASRWNSALKSAVDEVAGGDWQLPTSNFDTIRQMSPPTYANYMQEIAKRFVGTKQAAGVTPTGNELQEAIDFVERTRAGDAPWMGRKINDSGVVGEAIDEARRISDSFLPGATSDLGKVTGTLRELQRHYVAQVYGVPTDFNKYEVVRKALQNSDDVNLRTLARSDESDVEVMRGVLRHFQAQQAGRDIGEAWAWKYHDGFDFRPGFKPNATGIESPETFWQTSAGDLDSFVAELPKMLPELNGLSFRSLDDLNEVVDTLSKMPKEVLQTGLYNRSAVLNGVDYMLQSTKLKAALLTMQRALSRDEFVSASIADGIPLQQFWASSGLKSDGLAYLLGKRKGMAHDDLADLIRNPARDAELKALLATGNDLKVDPKIGKSLLRYTVETVNPEAAGTMMQAIDGVNAMLKGSLTLPYPGFHTRNRFSGAFANWASGYWSKESNRAAHDLWYGDITSTFKDVNGNELSHSDMLREVLSHQLLQQGAGGAHEHVAEQLSHLADSAAQFGGTHSTSLPDAVRHLRPWVESVRGPFGDVAETFKQAREEGGIRRGIRQALLGGTGNEGEVRTGILNLTSFVGGLDWQRFKARYGTVNPLTGKPFTRLEAARSDVTANVFHKAGENANGYVEHMNRVQPYIELRRRGLSATEAASKVKEVQFDYKALNDFEKRYLRRAVLFYSFMRKNFEQQMKLLIHNPGGRTAQIIRAGNTLRNEGRNQGAYVPRYLGESVAVPIGPVEGAEPGTIRFWNESSLFPHEEALNRFTFDNQGFPLDVRRTMEKFLATVNPLVQIPIEQTANKQLWSGRSLDSLTSFPTGDENVDYFLAKMPFSRALTMARGWTDPRKGVGQNIFNTLMGGVRITDVDTEKLKLYDARDALHQNLKGDPAIGEFASLYPKDFQALMDRAAAGDADALKQLQAYNNLRRKARDLNKSREAAKAAKATDAG